MSCCARFRTASVSASLPSATSSLAASSSLCLSLASIDFFTLLRISCSSLTCRCWRLLIVVLCASTSALSDSSLRLACSCWASSVTAMSPMASCSLATSSSAARAPSSIPATVPLSWAMALSRAHSSSLRRTHSVTTSPSFFLASLSSSLDSSIASIALTACSRSSVTCDSFACSSAAFASPRLRSWSSLRWYLSTSSRWVSVISPSILGIRASVSSLIAIRLSASCFSCMSRTMRERVFSISSLSCSVSDNTRSFQWLSISRSRLLSAAALSDTSAAALASACSTRCPALWATCSSCLSISLSCCSCWALRAAFSSSCIRWSSAARPVWESLSET
mmetsp:Transcript_41769/g.104404  ORF Transcript_41769/g.104404 Transcript_41769/m.104404 type:complete len:336 (-) Transcript_41769:158-1165(-)